MSVIVFLTGCARRRRKRRTGSRSYVNWLRVSPEHPQDVEERCSLGMQAQFENCEQIDRYAIFNDIYSGREDDVDVTLHGAMRHRLGVRTGAFRQR